jgi:hypothetical protein
MDPWIAAFEAVIGASDRPEKLELGGFEVAEQGGVVDPAGGVGIDEADPAFPDEWLHGYFAVAPPSTT